MTLTTQGAADEIRTRDIQLGRLTLYQLSYHRFNRRSLGEGGASCFFQLYKKKTTRLRQGYGG